MKNLQDRIMQMSPYFRGLDVYNDAIMVKVEFPSQWKVFDSEDKRIKITPSDNDNDVIFYYGNSSEVTYEDIFDLIENTIATNEELTKKLRLLQDKINELKELFSTSSYDDLVTLQFSIGRKIKPKRKYVKKRLKHDDEINNTEECKQNDEEHKNDIKCD